MTTLKSTNGWQRGFIALLAIMITTISALTAFQLNRLQSLEVRIVSLEERTKAIEDTRFRDKDGREMIDVITRQLNELRRDLRGDIAAIETRLRILEVKIK